jgi:hypothetical protein
MKKPRGAPFKKGTSGNPDGRPVLPPEVKALKSVTNEQIKEVMDLLLHKNVEELEQLADSESEPALKVLYAAGVLRAVKEGNPAHIELVLNRVLGKPKDSVELSGAEDRPIKTKTEVSISIEERVAQLKAEK